MLRPNPMETAPRDRVIPIYIPHLDQPHNKKMKNRTGWYRGIFNPRVKRWKIWFSERAAGHLARQPEYWCELETP